MDKILVNFFIGTITEIWDMGLSNMCNIALVKGTKSSNISLKNHNYLLKSYIFNTKCSSFNTNLLL